MWKAVNYEARGRGHIKAGIPCQDKTISYNINDISVIALADGAGSAKLSHYGAECVIYSICRFIGENFDSLIKNNDGKRVKSEIVNKAIEALEEKAEELECGLKDLSSTVLFVAVKENKFLMGHIGDGVIGCLRKDGLRVASRPKNGEYANSTIFITARNAVEELKIFKGELADISGFVLMSDGAAESFYDKRAEILVPVLGKIIETNAISNKFEMFESIKESFDEIIVNKTQDDCSIAILSKDFNSLNNYLEMNTKEKAKILLLKGQNYRIKKKIKRYDEIIEKVNIPKTQKQIAKGIYLKEKYTKKYLIRLVEVGLIKQEMNKFQRI